MYYVWVNTSLCCIVALFRSCHETLVVYSVHIVHVVYSKPTIPSSQGYAPQWLCLFAILYSRLGVPEQALGGIPLGFGFFL